MNKMVKLAAVALFLATPVLYATHAAAQQPNHPRIQKAIEALRGAEEEVRAAPHDFGGTRAGSLAAIRNALAALEQAAKYKAPAQPVKK